MSEAATTNHNWGIRAKSYHLRTRIPPFSWVYEAEKNALQNLLLPFKNFHFQRALDLGTGRGDSLPILLSLSQTISAIDLSDEMLRYAKETYQADQPERISFHHADAASIPFDDSYFDLVFSIGLAEYFQNPKILLNEIRRVSKPQAVVILTLSPENFGNRLRKLWGTPIYFHSHVNFSEFAMTLGFNILDSSKLYSQHIFALQLEKK
ncbi:MAG: class I SAM-dependent methyltransferase [Chloroherpetonaceae bacterium]|nr:class I SAM-dependent methyltransferase [Chloroherpetonaceae bacterium]